MHLGIGHGAAVEPDVDEVAFAPHGFALVRYKDDVVLFMTPAATAFSASARSSATEPMHLSSERSSVAHIGSGVPQKRERERFQSTSPSSHFPKRPVPVEAGFQSMVSLSSMSLSRRAVVRMNHESSG